MRRWLLTMGVVGLLGAAGLTGCASHATPATGLRLGVAYDVGGAGNPLNALVATGVGQARRELGQRLSAVREFSAATSEGAEDRYDRLVILCQSGYDPVLAVGYGYAGPDPATGPLARAVRACPGTHFGIVDDASVTAPTVANLVYADADGSYLVGVAAALTSHSGVVGFVGGCRIPQLASVEAGFRAGVLAGRPGAKVLTEYLSTDPASCNSGFAVAESGQSAAARMYAAGADVVYQYAGASGMGVFTAAKQRDTFGIGSVADQYNQLGPVLQGAVLTSMVKRVDRTVARFVGEVAAGHFAAGVHREGLPGGAVGYATSGGHVDPLRARLDADRQKIIDGKIIVPGGL